MKHFLTILYIMLPALLTAGEPGRAEEFRIGAYVDYGLNHHIADFRALPGVPNCCPSFFSGVSDGEGLGILGSFYLSDDFLLALRLGYSNYGARLVRAEDVVLNLEGDKINGRFEHTLEADIAGAGVSILADYDLGAGIFAFVGPHAGYLFKMNYSQQEHITRPADMGVFTDTGTRIRNKNSGEIPSASELFAAVEFGLRMEFPMNRSGSVVLSPRLAYSFGITNLVDGVGWRANHLRAGIAIIYSPSRKADEPIEIIPEKQDMEIEQIPEIKRDSLVIAEQRADDPGEISVTAVGVVDGEERPFAQMTVEEFLSTNMRPLLNYIFFEKNTTEIPERYIFINKSIASQFSENELHGLDALDTYYNILNIIGRRMVENPRARLTLTGCTSGPATEPAGAGLSRRRAEAVAEYLRKVWEIEPLRLSIRPRQLPENASDPDDPDGAEENRRVEIEASENSILRPVVTTDTLRRTDPPVIRFYCSVGRPESCARWTLSAMQSGRILRQFSGAGAPPDSIEWDVSDEQHSIPLGPEPVTYSLEISAKGGAIARSAEHDLPHRVKTLRRKMIEKLEDRRIDRYSLILFDFDEYRLDESNREIVEWIKGSLSDSSDLRVTGYTDRIGEEDYNLMLSLDRAREVGRRLLPADVRIFGRGEFDPPFTNELPEGRFYSRTVNIIAETPLDW